MNLHRAQVRPRWGRIGALAASAAVLATAVFGAVAYGDKHAAEAQSPPTPVVSHGPTSPSPSPSGPASRSFSAKLPTKPSESTTGSAGASTSSTTTDTTTDATALPPDSGTGRRAVYDITDQRVWIVDADDHVERTYLVSGSVENNLRSGTYSVYSRSRWAVGIDDSGVMQYFVRFAHGTDEGAAIGFHSIPTKDGKALQTAAQLGHPESHGCVRQATPDAIAMWNFAQIGTKVVVLA